MYELLVCYTMVGSIIKPMIGAGGATTKQIQEWLWYFIVASFWNIGVKLPYICRSHINVLYIVWIKRFFISTVGFIWYNGSKLLY